MLILFVRTAREVGLEVDVDETKLLRVGRRELGQQEVVYISGWKVEEVESFKLLEDRFLRDVQHDRRKRIASGNRSFYSLKEIFHSRKITWEIKTETYKAMERRVVTYRLETMGLTKEMEKKLDVFENNILKRICGSIYDEEEERWRKHNAEIKEK